jgi:hypothetical protein
MKKLVLFACALTLMFSVNAQIVTPQPSPFGKIEQKVGLTDVSIEYSRPGMRGRTIYGDLVPHGKLWRTGANQRTKITFSNDVVVDGQTLKAGSYAILTKPNETSWEVYFYTEYDGGGAPQTLDDAKVAAKTTVEVVKMPMNIETFTMTIDDLSNASATVGIIWESTYVGVKFDVPTDKAVTSSIEQVMAGPSVNDLFSSAVYYLEQGKDIKKAMTWIDKAVDMTKAEPRFWYLRQQSLIYAKAGDKAGAIKAAKASLAGAKANNNADYVKLNTDSLKEWGAM